MNRSRKGVSGCLVSMLMVTGLATGEVIVETEKRVDVGIRVTEQDGLVVAHLRFENRGAHPVLLLRGMNGIGYPNDPLRQKLGTTVNPEFAIHCEGERVRYTGKFVSWAPFHRQRFEVMGPGAVHDIRAVRLDNIYRLPDGAHTCTIVHTHYEYDDTREEAYAVNSQKFEFSYVKVAADR